MKLKSIKQLKKLKGKTVFVRVDYNVPIKNGQVLESERIERSFSTVNFLLKQKAKIILASHLGRPEGRRNLKFSMKPIERYLNENTRKKIQFVDDCIGENVKKIVGKMKPGQILLLENLRFYAQEEANDAKFAQELAELADIFVNDAFSVCHRAHSSVEAITNYLPSYAGFNLIDEVDNLSKLLKGFKKPAIAVIGGVKISTKISVLENLLKKYDYVLLGGALANNFLAVKKVNIGQSVYEKDFLKVARKLLLKYKKKIILPLDFRIAKKIKPGAALQIVDIEKINKIKNRSWQIVDIGPQTELYYERLIKPAQTVVWNGPMGIFEIPDFAHGTNFIAQKIALHAKGPAYGVVGGGETIAAFEKMNIKDWFDFVSTGGGAMLEFLEGKTLPGIKPLLKKKK